MKEQEALEIIEGGCHDYDTIYSALAVAVKALRMRIPKEAVLNDVEGFIECPSCGGKIAYLDDPGSHRFCLKCGQRLEVEHNAEQEN